MRFDPKPVSQPNADCDDALRPPGRSSPHDRGRPDLSASWLRAAVSQLRQRRRDCPECVKWRGVYRVDAAARPWTPHPRRVGTTPGGRDRRFAERRPVAPRNWHLMSCATSALGASRHGRRHGQRVTGKEGDHYVRELLGTNPYPHGARPQEKARGARHQFVAAWRDRETKTTRIVGADTRGPGSAGQAQDLDRRPYWPLAAAWITGGLTRTPRAHGLSRDPGPWIAEASRWRHGCPRPFCRGRGWLRGRRV